MMRSLWTAASGMTTQQLNVDNIANNLANVNTTGFKKERVEFQSLLYQTMTRANFNDGAATARPANLQVGHGVRATATTRMFTQGNMQSTESNLDFAIQGPGFFMVQMTNDQVGFTRDGTFKASADGDEFTLVTSQGYQILGVDGAPLSFPIEYNINSMTVDPSGSIFLADGSESIDTGLQIGIFQFPNTQGLEAIGGNILVTTSASGEPLSEADGETNTISMIVQGFLEMSNVQIAQEMVNLIIAQRAYELNSRAITTSDEMLQNANNLKR